MVKGSAVLTERYPYLNNIRPCAYLFKFCDVHSSLKLRKFFFYVSLKKINDTSKTAITILVMTIKLGVSYSPNLFFLV